MQEKKLIGYKLINKENEKIVRKALKFSSDYSPLFFIKGHLGGSYISQCTELGIMKWFEPVYEDLKPSFKQYTLESGFVVVVHKTGEVVTNDGTFTIKELDTKFGNSLRSTKFNKWDMSVTEAKYKIGCQVVTHTDIIGINELYKELNK